MSDPIRRVLVITAHPDDCEFGAGGTVAKFVKEGKDVGLVVVTNGDKGSSDRSMTSARLVAIREEEQRHASRTLGVEPVTFLGYPDGEVEDTRQLRRDVSREIRRYRPDLLICQNRLVLRTPVDRCSLAFGQAILEQLHEDPLCPSIIARIGCLNLVRPIKAIANSFQLFLAETFNIARSKYAGMNAPSYREVFAVDAKCIKTHWLKNIISLHSHPTAMDV